jgi:hypothetical protein
MWHDAYAFQGPCGEMEFDEGFKCESIVMQLSKIIDSAGIVPGVDLPAKKYKPITSVTTDDGYMVSVTAQEAQTILRSIQYVPTPKRLDYLKRLQSSTGLCDAIDRIRGYDNED